MGAENISLGQGNQGGEGTRLVIDSSEFPETIQVPRGILADEVEVIALPQDGQ